MPLNLISHFAANVATRNLAVSDRAASSSLAKLSAGTRVLTARDDAAALAIGSRLNAEVQALKQATVNAGQAISMLQIADGSMGKVGDILVRMKTLAVQAGSGQLSSTERAMLNTEYSALSSEVDRIATDTEFNSTQLVNGSHSFTKAAALSNSAGFSNITGAGLTAGNFSVQYASTAGSETFTATTGSTTYTGTVSSDAIPSSGSYLSSATVVTLSGSAASDGTLQLQLNQSFKFDASIASAANLTVAGTTTSAFSFKVGSGTSSSADVVSVTVDSITASALGVSGTSLTTQSNADAASTAVTSAINALQTSRANIGASQNRLEFAASNIAVAIENQEAARSNLLDLDVASEMANFTSKQLLVQAGVSMLAQANQLPGNLLRLFQ